MVWVYISEIFPARVRSRGQNIGFSAHWVTNGIISAVFPTVAARSNAYPFFFYSAMMALQFVPVLFFFPETKGATLEQLRVEMGID